MKLVGASGQAARHFTFDASGSISSGSAAQLVLPERVTCSSLFFQNISSASMYVAFGSARATCTISGGKVNTITVSNGGFGFTRPPIVQFLGGGSLVGNPSAVGYGLMGYPSPSSQPKAHAVLGGGVVTSIVIDDPGANFLAAPAVFLTNDPLDPVGCVDAAVGSGTGFLLTQGQSIYESCTAVTTDQFSVYCGTSTSKFTCRWMP